MSKIPKKLHPDFQDEFFLNLEHILVPIGGNSFECMGLELAFFIAHEYGAKIDLLHVGKNVGGYIDKYRDKLTKFEIGHELKVMKGKNVPRVIIEYWKEKKHNLVIMSGRRRPTIFDKMTIQSISNSVIPHIETEVLQVFPPSIKKISDKLKEVAVLLPYSDRDPFLLRWASAIASPQIGAKVKIYHIAEVPDIVPLEGAKHEKEIKKEQEQFSKYIDDYSQIFGFGQIIQPKFIIGHKVLRSLEFIFGKYEPDLVIIGKSKPKNVWEKISKPLSSKIRDKLLNTGVCIQYMM
jgi:hypothetical protein